MPNLALQPANVPGDVAFPPANAQALINFVAAYLAMSGLENLTGVTISPEEPAAADRDKLWAKQDENSLRVMGLYAFTSGRWMALPVVLPSGEDEPAGAKIGEMFYNTKLQAVRFFDGTQWTTNFFHSGASDERPLDVPTGYLFYDEEIGRLLKYTDRGYTTLDGAVGDVKMVAGIDEETALARNPGWVVLSEMRGRFPIGADPGGDIANDSLGGVTIDQMKLSWSAQGRSAEGGGREASASFIADLTINGTNARADGRSMPGLTALGTEKSVKLTPPYRAMIFLVKSY